MRRRGTTTATAMLLTVLITASAAGCVQTANGDGARYDSFEAAMEAPGPRYEPDEQSEAQDINLKILDPRDPSNAKGGMHDIVILLFTDEPSSITDASVAMDSTMLAMGHDTGEDEDPLHDAHGVYAGRTNHGMHGAWEVTFDVTRANGDTATFVVEFNVTQ
jgi:hypothetical protein